ncbi:MAG: hypothetical protein R3E90_13020 [Marinicella sp.]
MDADKIIKVRIVGFTTKGANGVEYFISKLARSKYNIQVVDQISEDVIVLVDGDTLDGQVFLTDTKNSQHKLLVAQYKRDQKSPYPWLMKPIIPNELIDKLIEVDHQVQIKESVSQAKARIKDLNHNKLASALSGKQYRAQGRKNTDVGIPTETVNFYSTNNYVQGVVMRCIKKATHQKPYVQAHLPFGDMVVDANERKVYLLIGNKHIRPYEKLRLTQSVMIRVIQDIDNVKDMVGADQVKALDDLLWDLSIAASFGRLPEGTDVDKAMRLKYWPNLTRVRCFDFAIQIAALWSQHSLSIRQVTEQLGIGHNFVYVFFAAANSLGLMTSEEGNVVELASQQESNNNLSIMTRLLSHLRKAS